MRRAVVAAVTLLAVLLTALVHSPATSGALEESAVTCPATAVLIAGQCVIDDGPLCPDGTTLVSETECAGTTPPLSGLVCPDASTTASVIDTCLVAPPAGQVDPPFCEAPAVPSGARCMTDVGAAEPVQCPDGFVLDPTRSACTQTVPALQDPDTCPQGARGQADGCHILVARGPEGCHPATQRVGDECFEIGRAPIGDPGTCDPGFLLEGDQCLAPLAPVGPFPCVGEQSTFGGDLCLLVREDAVPLPGTCPVNFQVYEDAEGCWRRLNTAADGRCPGGSTPIDDPEFPDTCRFPVPLVPGPLSCGPGYSLLQPVCVIVADLVVQPDPFPCPAGAFDDPAGNCRRPVANAPGGYRCVDPAAVIDGMTCTTTVPFESGGCLVGEVVADRCVTYADGLANEECQFADVPIPGVGVRCVVVDPVSTTQCPDGFAYAGAGGPCEARVAPRCAPATAVEGRCQRIVDPLDPPGVECPIGYERVVDGCREIASPASELVCPSTTLEASAGTRCLALLDESVQAAPYCLDGWKQVANSCVTDLGAEPSATCPRGFSLDDALGGVCTQFKRAEAVDICPVGALGAPDGCFIYTIRAEGCRPGELRVGNDCYRDVGDAGGCGAGQIADAGRCFGPIDPVGPFPCTTEGIVPPNLCFVKGDRPQRGPSSCPTGPGRYAEAGRCYEEVAPVDGSCIWPARVDPNRPGGCRREIGAIPGSLYCAPGFSLMTGECWIVAGIVVQPDAFPCWPGSHDDPNGNCRKPVANAIEYLCAPPTVRNGTSCLTVLPATAGGCRGAVASAGRCIAQISAMPTATSCAAADAAVPNGRMCAEVEPLIRPVCPWGGSPVGGACERIVPLVADAAAPTCNGLTVTHDLNTLGVNVLTGTPGDDVILGTPFADTIVGAGGNDVICGEGGADVLWGLSGDDTILGGPGDDIILAGADDDVVDGGDGDDQVWAQGGMDLVRGGLGDDLLQGGSEDDTILGGPGNDSLHGQSGEDAIDGEAGDDLIWGYDGADGLVGGPGNDIVQGMDGDDQVQGDAGIDTLIGGPGVDRMRGGDDVDVLWGLGGNDVLEGGPGNDVVLGNDGADLARGGQGVDWVLGHDGDDLLFGGDGIDLVWGGLGNDIALGEAGDDLAVVGEQGDDLVSGGQGNDTVMGDNVGLAAGADLLYGGPGNDVLWGFAGNDVLDGGDDDDVLLGGDGIDRCNGGPGIDGTDGPACEAASGVP